MYDVALWRRSGGIGAAIASAEGSQDSTYRKRGFLEETLQPAM